MEYLLHNVLSSELEDSNADMDTRELQSSLFIRAQVKIKFQKKALNHKTKLRDQRTNRIIHREKGKEILLER